MYPLSKSLPTFKQQYPIRAERRSRKETAQNVAKGLVKMMMTTTMTITIVMMMRYKKISRLVVTQQSHLHNGLSNVRSSLFTWQETLFRGAPLKKTKTKKNKVETWRHRWHWRWCNVFASSVKFYKN